MHEIRIAKDLSEIVLDVATNEKLSVVTRVNISFGEIVQIVPEIFEFAFREAVRGSIASEAVVNIEISKIKLKCRECGNVFSLNGSRFACRECNSSELEIIAGKEMFVKSIEGE